MIYRDFLFFLWCCFIKNLPCTLIWISLDGFRNKLYENKAPFLKKLISNGVYSNVHISSTISKTFPNHFTAVTGLTQDQHGIINNKMWDKDHGYFNMNTEDEWWWNLENTTMPIWSINQKFGSRNTAIVFWPGSQIKFGGILPEFYYKKYDSNENYKMRLDKAYELFESKNYSLIMVYISEIDTVGHHFGPNSIEVEEIVALVDGALSNFHEKVEKVEKVDWIISSDHGMSNIDGRVTYFKDQIGDISDYKVISGGPIFQVQVNDPVIADKILDTINKLNTVKMVRRSNELPKEFYYGKNSRVPTITIIMKEGYTMLEAKKEEELLKGDHGYPYSWAPTMNALFIAKGPSFKKNYVLKNTEMKQLYFIACKTLRITDHCLKYSYNEINGIFLETKNSILYYDIIIGFSVVFALVVNGVIIFAILTRKKTYSRIP